MFRQNGRTLFFLEFNGYGDMTAEELRELAGQLARMAPQLLAAADRLDGE
ncbi:hypothetical protein ACFQ36_02965 [Arthrobacter sp. GCM10027362]